MRAPTRASPAVGGVLPEGVEFRINTTTLEYERGIAARSIARTDDCGFVVVWESGPFYGDGHRWGVMGQRMSASGAILGTQFQVNTYTTQYRYKPAVAAAGNGAFIIVWDSYFDQDDAEHGVFDQRFDATGAPALDGTPRVTTGLLIERAVAA